jgi:hypothetical protein
MAGPNNSKMGSQATNHQLTVVPLLLPVTVVTLVSAEKRLQQSLIKLMEGDEEAAKDFDKWDQFVRNHPEFKQKEELKKVKWKNENTPINAKANRCIKSMIPSNIMLSCTLAMLESQLPKTLAKRIWSKKALWLTRISSAKISWMSSNSFN